MSPRGDQFAARVRAARAYADLNRIQLGELIGFSKETISRIESGDRPVSGDPVLLLKIADACSVPASFLERGFETDGTYGDDMEERMRALERRVADLAPTAGLTDGIFERAEPDGVRGVPGARSSRRPRPRPDQAGGAGR